MRLTDLFESVHGNSSSGPTSYECPMKDYSSDFMENVDLSSMSPYDFIPLDYSSLKQSFAKVYISVVEATNKRNVGAGILAAALLYGSWKACRMWIATSELESQDEYSGSPDVKNGRRDGARRNDYGDSAVARTLAKFWSDRNGDSKNSTFCSQLSQTRGTETADELAVISENFQRQLKGAVSKLDDFKFRLKELESNKLLLTGEIDARKQMINKLQDEISCERERRQQAELKVEMMSMEFSQIGQLRKEVTVKSAHVNRLEKLMSEKDDLQMKLFSDNVVLPRSVVEARAKEFGELQNRVHQLQAEIDSTRRFRDFDVGCQPCRYASSVWLEDRPLSLPASHLSEIQVSSKKCFSTDTSVALPESIMKKLPKAKLTFADRSPVLSRSMTKSVEKMSAASRSTTSASGVSHNKTPSEVKGRIDYHVLTESPSLSKTDDLSGSGSAHQKKGNLFAELQTLIGGFSDSKIDPSNIALLTDLGTILSRNRSNHRSIKEAGEKSSDEKSNTLAGLSAVSASDDSDTDNTQARSAFTGKSHGKKGTPLKRLSRYRRDKRKDNAHLKKKLAMQYFDGQTRLLGLEESPSFPSESSELAHLCKEESNTHQSSRGSIGDNLASADLQSFKSCDEQRTHGGDSWILIIPKDAKREQ